MDIIDNAPIEKPAIDQPLPTSTTWPPFKDDSPYRTVIVQLESEPLGVMKGQWRSEGLAEGVLVDKITAYYAQLELEHNSVKARLKQLRGGIDIVYDYYNVLNGLALTVHQESVAVLRAMPGVKDVTYDQPGYGSLMDSVKIVGADSTWQMKNASGAYLNGEGVVVAVLDTGIDYRHKHLGGGMGPTYKVIDGYDFVNKDTDPMDDHFHGTMVAGIIAADSGLYGIAPNASLLAYKVSDKSDTALITDSLAGLDRALDPDGVPVTNDSADIICMALSWFGTPYDKISQAVNNAHAAGSLVVVAAGNNGPELKTIRSPGAAYGALTVGMTDKSDAFPGTTSRGPVGLGHVKPELVAPGIDIYTTWPGDIYGYFTGTSAATPHVVGAAALLKQLHPDWGPEELRNAIVNNAYDLGESVVTQGSGRLDVLAAAEAELRAAPDVLAFEKNVSGIIMSSDREEITLTNLKSSQVSGTIDVTCFYSADLELEELDTPVSVDSYVQVNDESFTIPADGSVVREFQLNLPGTAKEGYYWGKIKISTADDDLTVPFGFKHTLWDQDYGDWLVNTDTTLSDKRILVKNLTVINGAELTLDKVVIFVSAPEDGGSEINITETASLVMKDCTVANYNPSVHYNFSIYGMGSIESSRLSGIYGVWEYPYPGGINILGDGSSVTNCTIFRCFTNGIFAYSVRDLLIADNHINHNGGEGILLWDVEDVSVLRNNLSWNWWDGVGMANSDGVIVTDNIIHYNSYDGIWINNSSPYVAHNNVTNSGWWDKYDDAAGIKFQRDSMPLLESNSFTDNKYHGMYINGSSPVVWNTTVSGSPLEDLYFIPFEKNYSRPRFINSTFKSVFWPLYDYGSKLTRQWLVRVHVTDQAGSDVEDVTVRIFDKTDTEIAVLQTNDVGLTPLFTATQYVRTSNKTEAMSPYRLELEKTANITGNLTDIQITSSKTVEAVISMPDIALVSLTQAPMPGFTNETINFTLKIRNSAGLAVHGVHVLCILDGNESAPFAEFEIARINASSYYELKFLRTIRKAGPHNLTVRASLPVELPESTLENNFINHSFTLYVRPTADRIDIAEKNTYVNEPVTITAVANSTEGKVTGYQFKFSDGTTTGWLENNTYQSIFTELAFISISFRVLTDLGKMSNWSARLWFEIIDRHPSSGITYEPAAGGDIKTVFTFAPSEKLEDISDIITTYHWDFGDGVTSTKKNTTHKFRDDRSYNITLTIRYSTTGAVKQFWTDLVVQNVPPEAIFIASSKSIEEDDKVVFNASTTADIDDDISDLTFRWDFGDGSPEAFGLAVSHVYEQDGVYTVTLTVEDDNNRTSQYQVEVTVKKQSSGATEAEGFQLERMTTALIIICILALVLIISALVLFSILRKKKLDSTIDEDEELEE